MGDILQAFFIFLALAAGTYLCGVLPGMCKAPPHIMNLMAIFGAGTIVGAALIIVISEASGIVITAQLELDKINAVEPHTDKFEVPHACTFVIGAAVMIGFSMMLIIDETFKIIKERQMAQQNEQPQPEEFELGQLGIQDVEQNSDNQKTALSKREEK